MKYRGGCFNYNDKKVGEGMILTDQQYDVQSCYRKCLENSECGAFFVYPVDGRCTLVKLRCVPHADIDGTQGGFYYELDSCSESNI